MTSPINVRRLAFGVWRLAFGVWRLAFGVRRSAFGVRRLASYDGSDNNSADWEQEEDHLQETGIQ